MLRHNVRTLIVWMLVGCGLVAAQTKRALLIGIDEYARAGEPNHPPTGIEKPKGLESEVSRWDLPTWPPLEGAVNDVHTMKELLASAKFGFSRDEPYTKVLTNRQATRQAILDAMRK